MTLTLLMPADAATERVMGEAASRASPGVAMVVTDLFQKYTKITNALIPYDVAKAMTECEKEVQCSADCLP